MTGPSPERWDEMKQQAYSDLFRKLVGDNIWTPPKEVPENGSITYNVRDSSVQQEVLSDSQPSPYGDRVGAPYTLDSYFRMADRIKRTYLDTYYSGYLFRSDDPDICPRCGQDRNRVRHCDPSAGFRREGFVDDPAPVKLTF